VMSYAQRHVKRLLAFSTVSHSGLMLCGIGLLDPRALGGVFVYVLGHGLVKGGLFMGSGILLNRYQTVDVEALRGKLRELPWLAVVLALGALGLAGLPPFGTFVGATLIDDGASRAHLGWLTVILLLTAALTGAAVLNAVGRMTFGWGPPPDPRAVTPGRENPETEAATGLRLVNMAIPTLALIALAIAFGFVPVASTAVAAAGAFADRTVQEAVVLAGGAPVPLPSGPAVPLGDGILHGAIGGALALALAALGLFADRLPIWPLLKRTYETAMRIPHAWHSGIVTDYVTWLTAGAAAFGAALLSLTR